MKRYKLVGKTPVEVEDMIEWAQWFESADRVVKKTTLPDRVEISTVFLGFDHGWPGDKPILFETMIFGGEHDGFQERYSTWVEVEAGHDKAIEIVFAGD